jgi:hypothetical protein
MLILPPRPNLAVIQFAVKNFVSLRHGAMMLTADPPKDVASSLTTSEAPPRVSMPDNDTFEFIRGGGPPISLAFAVLPEDEYAAVGLFVQKMSSEDDGGGVWDGLTVGNGPNDNVIYSRNTGRPVPSMPPITYKIYMLVRRRNAGADYPVGDIGVIDPVWVNR